MARACRLQVVRKDPLTVRTDKGDAQQIKRGLWTVGIRGYERFLVYSKAAVRRALCKGG